MSKLFKSITIIVALFVLFELTLFFTVNDLHIWLTYGNVHSASGIFMEVVGKVVAPIIFSLAELVIAVYYYREYGRFTKKSVIATIISIALLGYSIYVFIEPKSVWMAIVFSALLLGGFVWLYNYLKNLEEGRLFQLYCIAFATVVYCIAVLIVILTLKLTWGRIRPRALESLDQFTPWYHPLGFVSNSSFPSGHTADAAITFAFILFAPLVKNKFARIPLYVLPAIWTVFMAVSRVVVGAHFPSDTLYAIAISVVLFILTRKYAYQYIGKHLDDQPNGTADVPVDDPPDNQLEEIADNIQPENSL